MRRVRTAAQSLAAENPFCALIQREYVGGAPLTPGNYAADRKYKAQFINQGGIKSEGTTCRWIGESACST